MSAALVEIAALVQRESGVRLADGQLESLRAALDRLDLAGGAAAFLRGVADPAARPGLVARLLDEVTVKETFFLRDRKQLDGIDWQGLLHGARAAGAETVRVWSAACATGEEVYSLALLACEAFGTLAPPVTILGTDISPAALARAREGEYRQRSVRELGPELRRRYFIQQDEHHVVGEELRSLVTFGTHNLTGDAIPPLGARPFDLVLCRNVLIYFDEETVEHVVSSLERAVAPDGLLLLGAADALSASARRLRNAATRPSAQAPCRSPRRGRTAAAVPARPVIEPLDAGAAFLHGLEALERGDVDSGIVSLRRALYVEPRFAVAAFQLGRAYESAGNASAARRAYEQALRTLDSAPALHEAFLEHVDLAGVEAAARTRLEALASVGIAAGSRLAQ